MASRLLISVLILSSAVIAAAQSPNGAKASAAPAASPSTPAAAPAAAPELEPHGFTYAPEGRRDPFVSLLTRGSDSERSAPTTRPPGLSGLGASEVTLRGTL